MDMFSFFDSFFDERMGHNQSRGNREGINVFDYFSDRAQSLVQTGAQIAYGLNSKRLDTEHLLLAMLKSDDSLVKKIFKKFKLNQAQLADYLEQNVQKFDQQLATKQIHVSPRMKHVFQDSFQQAHGLQHAYIGPEHLLLSLLADNEGLAGIILRKHGLKYQILRDYLAKEVKSDSKENEATQSSTPNLDKFSSDLTAEAHDGKMDPVIGRRDEVQRVVQILSRRTKNNPILLGEPGVGKTAIVEGLAQRIATGNVPETLKDKRVLSLDLSALLAGSKYRGEFEERIKNLMKEIDESDGKIILFVDEIHMLIGAGATEGPMDAANILKPALSRGGLQVIGATTLMEYKKYIEKDAALERRFQQVIVNEPSIEDTIEILKGLKDRYEAHHRVGIADEALESAARLSDQYINDRFLPDKAIDLVDEAAAKVHLAVISAPEDLRELEREIKDWQKEEASCVAAQDFKKAAECKTKIDILKSEKKELEEKNKIKAGTSKAVVTAVDICELIAQSRGIEVSKISTAEANRFLHLESALAKKVIGQKDGIKAVSEAMRRSRAGLKDPRRPIGTFMFLGPTGVGKTELAKALTAEIFNDREAMVRLDMSEYMERHSVAKLIGSPPGYVGFDEGGQLTEKIRRKPYSVILLDEIEKAHPDVFNILLQIFDEGRLTDAQGRTVDFKHTLIIATSNVGADLLQEHFQKSKKITQKLEAAVLKKMQTYFRPEFLNRMDDIIFFNPLTKPEVAEVLDLLVADTASRLVAKGIEFTVDEQVKKKLVDDGYSVDFGARPMKREVQKQIENPLASYLISGEFGEGDAVKAVLENGEIKFVKD